MKTRRMLTMLLALMLMVSLLAVTASAEEEMDYSPHLCFSWLNNQGEGWYEEPDQELEWNRGFSMTALDEMWQMYYYATWNGSEWEYTPIDPAELVVENLTVTPFTELPAEDVGDVIPGHDPKYFCRVNANDWGDASVSYTLDDGTELTMGVSVQRNEDGFYSSMTLNNDTYINRFRVNPLAEEHVFYFGFQSTYWTLKEVELRDGADQYVTLEPTNKSNVYKITVKPEVAENIWSTHDFEVGLTITVYNDDDPENYREEVWCPGIWCEPVWQHEVDFDAKMSINHEEYNILGDVVMKNVFKGTESDDEGNTWEVWQWEKTELPDGVSYDVETNTLTLDNANLNQLVLTCHWIDEENGNEGWDLPNENLTIELIGKNSIESNDGWALGLGDNVNAVIAGSGSLYLKTTNEIRQNEWGDYCADHTVYVWSGSSLTIADNANVTAEIAGEAWNGNDEWHEQAHLQVIEMGQGDLTLCDNAVLTTVVPEGALASGAESHPDDPWYFPGGYGGIGGIGCLTVNDNAALNTTNLNLDDHWLWDEEKQEDYYVGSGRLALNGGTVNITSIPELSYQEDWYWDEETESDVAVCYNRYDFRGICLWGQDSALEVNGGELNVTIAPTEEQNEAGVYCEAISGDNGDMTVSGGTVNLNIPHGCGLYIGGWNEDQNGTLTMNGGEINMTEGYNWIEVAPYGSVNLSGGTIHIANGELTLCTNWEYIEEADTHVRTAYPTVVIDGANVIIDNGHLNMDGDLILNSGMMSVTQQGDPNRGPDDYVWLARANGNLTVNGGELNLIGNDVNAVFETYGDVHQTGGDFRCIINESDEWRKYCRENWGYTPRTYAFQSYANVTVDGGFFVGYGHYGISVYENGDNKFVVNGGEVLGNGEMNGIMLYQDAEFNGGMVRAISRGRLHTTYNGETGEPLDFYAGNAIALVGDNCLTINGGDHRLEGHINEGLPKASIGISLWDSARAAINGGSMRISADLVVSPSGWSEPVNPVTLGEGMRIHSLLGGQELEFIMDHYYAPVYDDEGNPVYDEEGNLVFDESVTYYDFWIEEDGVYEGGEEEMPDWSTDVVVTSNKCGDDATWSLEDGVLTVTGTGAIYDYSDHLCTGIAPWMWLHDNNLIKTVELADTITAIGDYAFWHRDEISAPVEAAIGVNVTEIGKQAFASDAVLTVVCDTAGEDYVMENGLDATVLHAFTNGKCGRCGFVMESPFSDVPAGQFYFDPVVWAVENGVTTGSDATHFNPTGNCQRAHVVTFLWRAAGSPEPTTTSNPFVDVKASDFYYKAVLWAVENGVTNGVDSTHFGPFAYCNRAQVVTFLYRAMGNPEYTTTTSPFTDVTAPTAFYYDAVLWAVENNITNGMGDGTFGIDAICNRAQVVTFLYRTYVNG